MAPKRKAYLDTSVIVDHTLKPNSPASAAIEDYDSLIASQYACQEFRAGPLRHFIWAHNKLTEHGVGTVGVLTILSETSVYRPSQHRTALEALMYAAREAERRAFDLGSISPADRERLETNFALAFLKARILTSWAWVEELERIGPLKCAPWDPPMLKDGRLEIGKQWCPKAAVCEASIAVRQDKEGLRKLKTASQALSKQKGKDEHVRRADAIEKALARTLEAPLCRRLGDAAILLFWPSECDLLTTNSTDFGPLCEALGRKEDLRLVERADPRSKAEEASDPGSEA